MNYKSEKMEGTTRSTLFVFYTINPEASTRDWTYQDFPDRWFWVGSGSVNPVRGEQRSVLYHREEQFDGPIVSRQEMREYLTKYFQQLINNGSVLCYKIVNHYSP